MRQAHPEPSSGKSGDRSGPPPPSAIPNPPAIFLKKQDPDVSGGELISSTLNQPQKILIKALLAPDSPLGEEFIAEEKERKEKGERSQFYDVTAWSLPLTYGIDAYWTAMVHRFPLNL